VTKNDPYSGRIYLTITIGHRGKSVNEIMPHTFGFEFYVATDLDQQEIFQGLKSSDEETGIARYLGRAGIFERLGLLKLARNEYKKALQVSPNNSVIIARLTALESPCDFR
jgi:hypothetical protein